MSPDTRTHINTRAHAQSDPTPPLLPLLLQLSDRITCPEENVAAGRRERDCSIAGDRRQQQQSRAVQVRGEGGKKGGGGRRRCVHCWSECGTPRAKRRIYSQSKLPSSSGSGPRGDFFTPKLIKPRGQAPLFSSNESRFKEKLAPRATHNLRKGIWLLGTLLQCGERRQLREEVRGVRNRYLLIILGSGFRFIHISLSIRKNLNISFSLSLSVRVSPVSFV